MAFVKMQWKRDKSTFRVRVRARIKNTYNPAYTKRVRVNVSISNYVAP